MDRLVTVLREDVRDEEDLLLPRVQDAVGTASLRLLGVAWELVRRIAPTRPHPVVSRRPPGNALAAIPLSIVNRLRDRVDGLLDGVPGRADGAGPDRVWAGTSQGLTQLSHRIERFGLFTIEEDPTTSRG